MMLSKNQRSLYYQVIRSIVGCQKLLLSYSGGLDSTVLLDILVTLMTQHIDLLLQFKVKLPISLRAIYVHHALNDQADNWVHHCYQQCQIRNIPFSIIHINCSYKMKNKKGNIEAFARNLRYQRLFDNLRSTEVLLTAHHMDDQAETVLLALKRGSGPAGLSGINKYINYDHKCRLIRPLLQCSKKQLKEYAYGKSLNWIEDSTNADERFDRNFLRLRIMPLLRNRWPCFNAVVARTAQLCANQEILLQELLSESLKKLINFDGSLCFFSIITIFFCKKTSFIAFMVKKFSFKNAFLSIIESYLARSSIK